MKWYWWALIVLIVLAIIWYFMVYRKRPANSGVSKYMDDATKRKFENECESSFNTQAEVDKCVKEKAIANGYVLLT